MEGWHFITGSGRETFVRLAACFLCAAGAISNEEVIWVARHARQNVCRFGCGDVSVGSARLFPLVFVCYIDFC